MSAVYLLNYHSTHAMRTCALLLPKKTETRNVSQLLTLAQSGGVALTGFSLSRCVCVCDPTL